MAKAGCLSTKQGGHPKSKRGYVLLGVEVATRVDTFFFLDKACAA